MGRKRVEQSTVKRRDVAKDLDGNTWVEQDKNIKRLSEMEETIVSNSGFRESR